MDLDLAQLRALDATVREGTLEAAARALHVTPSAISQRLRALEVATGRSCWCGPGRCGSPRPGRRCCGSPGRSTCSPPTSPGSSAGTPTERVPTLPIAVNADSMATWVLPALAPLAGEVCFDLYREDQEHTSDLLRAGTVMAAVTSEAEPVPGCSSTRLGGMRYRPMAAPASRGGGSPTAPPLRRSAAPRSSSSTARTTCSTATCTRSAGPDVAPPVHDVPAAADFVAAVGLGLGWGMVPDHLAAAAAAELIDLDPAGAVDVVLHWQQWRLRSPTLDRVREAVLAAAGRELTGRTRAGVIDARRR